MLKIAYCAGHYLGTPGKRVPKALDPGQTREWTLNARVAEHFAQAALEYAGVELLRTDDPTGKNHISIKNRTRKANSWNADLYLDLHHNAGILLGKGGGVVVYCYPGSRVGRSLQREVYDAVVAAGGLKGNRAKPLVEKKLTTLKYAKAPALVIEYGFMDSRTDYPIISRDSYAKQVAYATMEAVARVYALEKKCKKLTVDGLWGSETTARLQQIFGTAVDGVVTGQHKAYEKENPGLVSGWDWDEKPNGKGSPLIRKMQAWAGMPENRRDGILGPETVKAFQKKLGTPTDGRVSRPSQMVKALQTWANGVVL